MEPAALVPAPDLRRVLGVGRDAVGGGLRIACGGDLPLPAGGTARVTGCVSYRAGAGDPGIPAGICLRPLALVHRQRWCHGRQQSAETG